MRLFLRRRSLSAFSVSRRRLLVPAAIRQAMTPQPKAPPNANLPRGGQLLRSGGTEPLLVNPNRGDQQITVGGALVEDFVIDDELPLRFLHFDHLAKFGRLLGLAAPDDLGGVLKHAGQFSCYTRIDAEPPRPRLKPHLLHPTYHGLQFLLHTFQRGLLFDIRATFDARGNLVGEPLRLTGHPPATVQHLAIQILHPLLALFALAAADARNFYGPQFHTP